MQMCVGCEYELSYKFRIWTLGVMLIIFALSVWAAKELLVGAHEYITKTFFSS